jgi:environmental stress-induced protein Ves
MSRFRPVASAAQRTEPWANGAGTTTVLASGPNGPNGVDWQWRLSIARIEQDADFSPLPGVRRHFAVLDAPLTLHFPDGRRQALLRLAVDHFDGGQPPRAVLHEGPTRAFNLMLRGKADGELLARPLNGAMVLPAQAGGHWFVYLLAGKASIDAGDERATLDQGQSLWIDPLPGDRLRIDGGGEIILVRLRPQ